MGERLSLNLVLFSLAPTVHLVGTAKSTRFIPDGWAYQVMVRLTSWIPSLAMYLAARTPVPQMT
jgi:hypothetical protein